MVLIPCSLQAPRPNAGVILVDSREHVRETVIRRAASLSYCSAGWRGDPARLGPDVGGQDDLVALAYRPAHPP